MNAEDEVASAVTVATPVRSAEALGDDVELTLPDVLVEGDSDDPLVRDDVDRELREGDSVADAEADAVAADDCVRTFAEDVAVAVSHADVEAELVLLRDIALEREADGEAEPRADADAQALAGGETVCAPDAVLVSETMLEDDGDTETEEQPLA